MFDRFTIWTTNLLAVFPEGNCSTSQFNGPKSIGGLFLGDIVNDVDQLIDQILSLKFRLSRPDSLTTFNLSFNKWVIHQFKVCTVL